MSIEPFNTDASDLVYKISFVSSLKNINRAEWNALIDQNDPFLCYEFLSALENNNCLSEEFGWYPHHLIVRNESNVLIAAIPFYIKTNSYGEFVFDWSWASAYEQAGLAYYPKLISSVPYTPVTGKRILLSDQLENSQKDKLTSEMIQAAIHESESLRMSGVHWLFNKEEENKYFQKQQLMFRLGYQFHWNNQ